MLSFNELASGYHNTMAELFGSQDFILIFGPGVLLCLICFSSYFILMWLASIKPIRFFKIYPLISRRFIEVLRNNLSIAAIIRAERKKTKQLLVELSGSSKTDLVLLKTRLGSFSELVSYRAKLLNSDYLIKRGMVKEDALVESTCFVIEAFSAYRDLISHIYCGKLPAGFQKLEQSVKPERVDIDEIILSNIDCVGDHEPSLSRKQRVDFNTAD